MTSSLQNAFLGSLIADSVSMPVHWYYDTSALDRDYGEVDRYLAPRNPHSGSILWRSHYQARNELGEILHDQAQYWGQRGIHYHQFLAAGENTINYQLAIELYRSVAENGVYDPDKWLDLYIERMRSPGWHQDTYLEEYHRGFFDHLAQGRDPRSCGLVDVHIGGIVAVPALIAALDLLNSAADEIDENTVRSHVELTHHGPDIDSAAIALTRMLLAVAGGKSVREAIEAYGNGYIGKKKLEKFAKKEDRWIIGQHFSPACYLPESFTASLCLAWKYADDFSSGILANVHCGGDNCHRGVVVGALLGAGNLIPEKWIEGLVSAKVVQKIASS